MTPSARLGADSSITGATVRAAVAVSIYFATLVAVRLVTVQVPTPTILANLPDQIATLCSVATVLFVSARIFDTAPASYGLTMTRRWIRDLLGGIVVGVVFQLVSTAAILGIGAGAIVDRWSMGVFTDPAAVVIAVGSTVAGYFIVALGEDLLFRGVLIREFVVGLTSRGVSRSVATVGAVIASALLFGSFHLNAGAAGLSTAVVVLQAVVGGLYFGLAYVLTDSLALPVGIHLSTNLWTTVVFGQPGSGYPAAFRLTRPFSIGPDLVVILFLPVGVLVAAIFVWVRLTRGAITNA